MVKRFVGEREFSYLAALITIVNAVGAVYMNVNMPNVTFPNIPTSALLWKLLLFLFLEVFISWFFAKAIIHFLNTYKDILATYLYVPFLYILSAYTSLFNIHFFFLSALEGIIKYLVLLFSGLLINIIFVLLYRYTTLKFRHEKVSFSTKIDIQVLVERTKLYFFFHSLAFLVIFMFLIIDGSL